LNGKFLNVGKNIYIFKNYLTNSMDFDIVGNILYRSNKANNHDL